MENNNVKIEPMRECDLDDCEKIGRDVFGEFNRRDFLNCISRSEVYSYFTLKQGRKVLGYFGIMHIADDGELLTIAVDKKHQHKGYGRLMLNEALLATALKGSSKIFLEVNETNENAIKLYLKNGFKEISRRPNYYGENAAIIMQKDL